MDNFTEFIQAKIKAAEDQADKVNQDIERKAGPLIAKRKAFEDEAASLKKLLKEFQQTTKAKK